MNDMVIAHWIAIARASFMFGKPKRDESFVLVNAEEATNVCAFDHQALASSLSSLLGRVLMLIISQTWKT